MVPLPFLCSVDGLESVQHQDKRLTTRFNYSARKTTGQFYGTIFIGFSRIGMVTSTTTVLTVCRPRGSWSALQAASAGLYSFYMASLLLLGKIIGTEIHYYENETSNETDL